MFSSQQQYYPSSYSPESQAEDFCVSLLPPGHQEFDSKSPYQLPLTPPTMPASLLSSQLSEAAAVSMSMAMGSSQAVSDLAYQQRPRSSPAVRQQQTSNPSYLELDPWFMFSDMTANNNTSATGPSSIYNSPPTLSLSTNMLDVSSTYSYNHPDSGIQVTPNTAITGANPMRFGTGASSVRSNTPATDFANSPLPMVPSSYASSEDGADAWESHQAMRQQRQHTLALERSATFDVAHWSSRFPTYPGLVQPTNPSSYPSPAPSVKSVASFLPLKHRSTGVADASICGRESGYVRENKRIRLSPSSGSDYSSEDEAVQLHGPIYSTDTSPQLSKCNINYGAPKARKGRRKLGAVERKEVHELRKMGACTRCWGLKMKCGEGSPCPRCLKLGGSHQCVRVHFIDLDVFSRWLNDSYSRSMMHNSLRWASTAPARSISVSHEENGLTLPIRCHEFIPVQPDQLDFWYKDAYGWQSVPTTPFAMKKGVNVEALDKYVDDHVDYYVETHFKDRNPILHETFKMASKLAESKENVIVKDALKLWTTHQLLLKGATITGEEKLRMSPVNNLTSSSLNGKVPMPRVMANQLDHLLERRIWQLERQLLSDLQRRILSRKREEWLRVYLSLAILLNTLERDTWRLYYWYFHSQDGYAWRHPLSPSQLIDKNIRLSDSLAAHFTAISKGLTPFSLDWSRDQTMSLVSKDEEVVNYMEKVGKMVRDADHQRRRRNILNGYVESNEQSLDFLYSTKIMIV